MRQAADGTSVCRQTSEGHDSAPAMPNDTSIPPLKIFNVSSDAQTHSPSEIKGAGSVLRANQPEGPGIDCLFWSTPPNLSLSRVCHATLLSTSITYEIK